MKKGAITFFIRLFFAVIPRCKSPGKKDYPGGKYSFQPIMTEGIMIFLRRLPSKKSIYPDIKKGKMAWTL